MLKKVRATQITIRTNFVVVSSVGIKKVDCMLKVFYGGMNYNKSCSPVNGFFKKMFITVFSLITAPCA